MLNCSVTNDGKYQVWDSQWIPQTGYSTLTFPDFVVKLEEIKPFVDRELSDNLVSNPAFMRDLNEAEQQLQNGQLLSYQQVFGE